MLFSVRISIKCSWFLNFDHNSSLFHANQCRDYGEHRCKQITNINANVNKLISGEAVIFQAVCLHRRSELTRKKLLI